MKKLLTLIFVLGLSLPALAEEKTLICKGIWPALKGELYEITIKYDSDAKTIEGRRDGETSPDGTLRYFITDTEMGWVEKKGYIHRVSRFDGTHTVSRIDVIYKTGKCVLFKQAF